MRRYGSAGPSLAAPVPWLAAPCPSSTKLFRIQRDVRVRHCLDGAEEAWGGVLADADPSWRNAGGAASAAALGLGAPEMPSTDQATTLACHQTDVLGAPDLAERENLDARRPI